MAHRADYVHIRPCYAIFSTPQIEIFLWLTMLCDCKGPPWFQRKLPSVPQGPRIIKQRSLLLRRRFRLVHLSKHNRTIFTFLVKDSCFYLSCSTCSAVSSKPRVNLTIDHVSYPKADIIWSLMRLSYGFQPHNPNPRRPHLFWEFAAITLNEIFSAY